MREIDKISEGLFEKIRDRFEDVSLGDDKAKATSDPQKARFFNFDYVIDDVNHGNITMSLIDETSLKVYFSKNISSELDDEQQKDWYRFLRELREFARRNLLSFEPRDITRSTLKHRDIQQQSKADSTYAADEVVSESRMYGTVNRSFESFGPVRIKLQHSKPIVDEANGARSRNIQSIFVENDQGERFRLPFNNLTGARAMARHVSAGGVPTDDLGRHITEMVNEMTTLRPFVRGMSRRTFEDTVTTEMVESAFGYHALLKNTLKKMKGKKGYTEFKESFSPALVESDANVAELKELFVKKTLDERIEQALPLVQKAYNIMKENNNPYSKQFESWANNVAEGWDDSEDAQQWGEEPINVDDLADLFGDELPLGVDAINAINAISGIINSNELEEKLTQASAQDPTADARDIVIAWLEENVPAVYQELMNEIGDQDTPDQYSEGSEYGAAIPGGTENMLATTMEEDDDEESDSTDAIANAIVRRILNGCGQGDERCTALLRKLGPEGIVNAAVDIAEFAGPVDEIGSSDVSGWVAQMERDAGLGHHDLAEAFNRALGEGRMKDVDIDLKELSDAEFVAKYNKTKKEMKAALGESVAGDDHVDKDVKMKRMGAKPLGMMDKLKGIKHGFDAARKGESEDELKLYNKSKSSLEETSDEQKLERYHELIKQGMDPDDAEVEVFNDEGDEDAQFNEDMAQMRRIAGLK